MFNTTANLPYGHPVNTDIDYCKTFLAIVQTFSYFC